MPALASIFLSMCGLRSSVPVQYREYPEQASQSFKKGQWVTVNSAGQIAIFAADGANLASTGDKLVGIAQENATGTQGTLITVALFDGNLEALIPVYSATPASAITAQTLVDETYVVRNVGGVPMVMLDTTTNPTIIVTDILRDEAVGSAYGFVAVRPIAAERLTA